VIILYSLKASYFNQIAPVGAIYAYVLQVSAVLFFSFSPSPPQEKPCGTIFASLFLRRRGAESLEPAHYKVFLCKLLMFVDFLWRVPPISARFPPISARFPLFSAQAMFSSFPLLSLSKLMKRKKNTVKKRGKMVRGLVRGLVAACAG